MKEDVRKENTINVVIVPTLRGSVVAAMRGGSGGGAVPHHAGQQDLRPNSSEVVYECPDYQTAGTPTSVWVNYNITVSASNALGGSLSEPVVVDVAYIVQPHTPENVTVSVLEDREGTFFRVSWDPPPPPARRTPAPAGSRRSTSCASSWTAPNGSLVFVSRREHYAGQQKTFSLFSLRSGGTYLVQLRCKPVRGFWRESPGDGHGPPR
ncbi:hypothetical protein NHX12_028082 [Muraenolepis orangiensis]|uniref:Prolactin receptor n=1 Tax=Muraenolepis orangiensis TaxID=630683 RepID=A0A9Q0IPG8_9TELE|nr:hypothetical protein NHX12_028082 [Muraenolepis orangiensis]